MILINRYIFRECLINTLVTLSIFTTILLTGKILKLANLIINKGVDFYNISLVFVYIIPTFLEFAIPISVLIGVILTINKLSSDSELIVIKSSGLSIKNIIPPIFILGTIASICCYSIAFYIRPLANEKLQLTLFEIAKSRATAGLSAGTFNKLGKLIIYAEKINSGVYLENVLVDDQRDIKNRRIIFSKNGEITANDKDSSIIFKLNDGVIHERLIQSYSVTDFIDNILSISTDEIFNIDETSEKRASEMYLNELFSNYNKKNVAEFYRRVFFPLSSLILAIYGLILGISNPRGQKSWEQTVTIASGLIIFTFYYGFSSIFISIAKNTLPILFAGLTNIIFIALGIYLFNKLNNEKWASVIEKLSFRK